MKATCPASSPPLEDKKLAEYGGQAQHRSYAAALVKTWHRIIPDPGTTTLKSPAMLRQHTDVIAMTNGDERGECVAGSGRWNC